MSSQDPVTQELSHLSESLGPESIRVFSRGSYEIALEDFLVIVYCPSGYPSTTPPEINVVHKKTDPPFTAKELQEQVVHLWESSERLPVVGDVLEWIAAKVSRDGDTDGGADHEEEDTKDDYGDYLPDPERKLIIYTWGDQMQKKKPPDAQRNFNAKCLNCRGGKVDLRTMNGTWPELQDKVQTSSSFHAFRRLFINSIEANDYTVVSVNCSKGRHRCASFAEVMRKDYPKLVVHHLSLKVTTSSKDLKLRSKKR